jgi:hypothetical protein
MAKLLLQKRKNSLCNASRQSVLIFLACIHMAGGRALFKISDKVINMMDGRRK